ncbi:baseplate J/gp47 family protein [Citrobacter freundii]|uniref:baseplate J/gp47 family protein n=1 Tax=Citrobacter freundii TaxID=546 RepID=UPI001BD1B402|nr:baseplate J/gp47 family protein [Citrobacter freundii]HBU6168905.1 baseplate J/gp47 family protein [Citrobacter freundii]HBV8021131.1 baseplate J/gp47 family protein [Citrobacter freundii]HEG1872471.1 baseplate J/gp47 family protein [Citrobacter freundii]
MPYKHPTLTQLRQQVKGDILSELPETGGLLRFSNLGIMGNVQAGMAYMHYGYLDYIAQQSTPFTSTDEYLEGWAALKTVYRKPAAAATCPSCIFTGTPGAEISSGAKLNRADGYQYSTDTMVTIGDDGTGTCSVTAILPDASKDPTGGGLNGNAVSGTVVTLDQAFTGIQSTGTFTAPATSGANIEQDPPLQSRMLKAYQNTPQGGNNTDFENWALSVEGVTRAWSAPRLMGAGSEGVYIMCDGSDRSNHGFPTGTDGVSQYEPWGYYAKATGDQLRVADAIYSLQPVTCLTWLASPVPKVIDFVLSGITEAGTDLTPFISVAIDTVFFENGTPDGRGVIYLSDLNTAIAAVPGTEGFIMTSPTGNIPLALGELPQLGTVTLS